MTLLVELQLIGVNFVCRCLRADEWTSRVLRNVDRSLRVVRNVDRILFSKSRSNRGFSILHTIVQ